MKLCVIGTGYVGLVGAAVFANWGHRVWGVDIDKKKIQMIKDGVMPIYEPGLAELVKSEIEKGTLSFTTSLAEGMREAEVVFICVGTPQGYDGAADLSHVWNVAADIGKNIREGDHYRVIVTKSTVPVGTNEEVKRIVAEFAKAEFDVASNPEFLREGSSIEDMQNTDRTVVGTENEKAMAVMREFYKTVEAPLVECSLRSSEMIKYASNAFLATKISFINEMAQLCELAQADVSKVAEGMGHDRRIGRQFLNASIGYGGSCFPKDVAALYKTSTDQAYDFKLLRSVMEVNELQREYFLNKVIRSLGMNLSGKTIAVLGLAFKADTDDVRESVAVKIVRDLRGYGATLRVFDPEGAENARKDLGDAHITYCKDEYETMKNADALCILTEWKQFAAIDLTKTKELMNGNEIFDGRNLLKSAEAENAGFIYHAIGKYTNGTQKIKANGNVKNKGVLLKDKK